LLSSFRAVQYAVEWSGGQKELENGSARREVEVVGRLDKEQLGSTGGLVEE
jgi:hypothetical protein